MVVMTKNIFSIFTFSLLLVLTACKPKYEATTPAQGEMNPTRFVMLGGGHAAGYMDDALTFEGQTNSVSNILAEQFKTIGGGAFNQPYVSQSSMGVSMAGLAPFKLGYKTDCKNVTSLSPVRIATGGDLAVLNDNLYSVSNKFGNFGIPGLKLMDVSNTAYANSNPFFKRMTSSTTASVLDNVIAVNPTFFSVFLGIEDVMDYAKSGGVNNNLPSTTNFEAAYSNLVSVMTANGAKGVVATIPDVTKMPYFTTIPWNGLNLDESNVTTLNNIYNPLNFYFQLGSNPFMILDPAANDFGVRQLLDGELLLLSVPLDSVKCNQMGVLFPLRNEFVLTLEEISTLRSQIAAYNTIIKNIAVQYNLAVVETDKFAENLKDGFVYNGISMSAKFVSGGAYSLDGIHFNAKGNALLANEFIKAINKKYKSTLHQVNAGNYDATLFP
ncbi:MAG: hypothetical protein FGM14_09590 [Flavobacteriales bacterium]|nr:hypothetical protein [Flavobacteriales bacterium]